MAPPVHSISRYRFGAFELEAASGELRKAGIPIKLRLQAIQVLLMLAERAGQIVTREEIRGKLWSVDTFVDFERSINFCINQIRAALGDDAEKPRYVETLPKRGYRFIASLTVEPPREPVLAVGFTSTPPEFPRQTEGFSASANVNSGNSIAFLPPPRVSATTWRRKYLPAIGGAVILACATIGAVNHKWSPRSRGPNFQDMQITKLTDNGAVGSVAISPDGHFIAYARAEGEKQSLWLRQVETRTEARILPADTPEFHGLTFSPDGNYIYFVRSDRNDPWFKYLYVLSTLGGMPQRLISDVDSPVSFSPDGREYAYEHCIPARNELELKIVKRDGGGDRILTAIQNASCYLFQPGLNWSRDGSVIAASILLAKKPVRWALNAVSVADGSTREIFSSPSDIGRPVWLPGGSSLLVPHLDKASRRSQLWTISFPNGEAHKFTNDLSDYTADLDATPDGSTVVASVRSTVSNVWVFPSSDLSKGKQITSGAPPMIGLAEATDGRLFSVSQDSEIWTMNPDGSQRGLFTQVHNSGSPSLCGRYVLFMHFTSEELALMRADADGTHLTKLVSGDLSAPVPCSPDGKLAFYTSADGPERIWKIPVAGGAPAEIGDILGDQIAGRLSVSPDGKFLTYSYTRYDQTPSRGWTFAVIPIAGGPPVKQIAVPGGVEGLRLSPKGTAVQFLMARNGATNLWEQPLAGGDPRPITRFTSGRIFDFEWSSGGKSLLMTRGETSSEVVLLSNLR